MTDQSPREGFIKVIGNFLSAPSWAFGSYARTIGEQLFDKLDEAGLTVTRTGNHPDAPAIVITRAQLASMTRRRLTPEFIAAMDEAWPNSSIPEALDVIADQFAEETGAYAEWDDAEVEDHLTGSGAGIWPWWKTIERSPDGRFFVEAEDPDNSDANVTKWFTVDEVRRARDEIIAGQHGINDTTIRDLRDDADANAIDCLLQILVYGDVVYC